LDFTWQKKTLKVSAATHQSEDRICNLGSAKGIACFKIIVVIIINEAVFLRGKKINGE
jgi:hypothetical protein